MAFPDNEKDGLRQAAAPGAAAPPAAAPPAKTPTRQEAVEAGVTVEDLVESGVPRKEAEEFLAGAQR